MKRRAPEPADLGTLSGCAAELAEAFVSLASDIALVIDDSGVIRSVAQNASAPMAPEAERIGSAAPGPTPSPATPGARSS